MRNDSSNREIRPEITKLRKVLQQMIELGASDDVLNDVIRESLKDMASRAEDEMGYLLPRSNDPRTRGESLN